jgi:kynureninase
VPGFTVDRACAEALDAADPLRAIRDQFIIPNHHDGTDEIYLVGNSLGALPRLAVHYVTDEFERWGRIGVRGHFEGDTAWKSCHELVTDQLAALVGAQANEVVAMNSLTVNLHSLMVSFYRPTRERHKVLIEAHAFPSDHFAVESQIRQRGFEPATSLVVIAPADGDTTLEHHDIVRAIRQHGDELALVLLPGVQYYTGQVLDMEAITAAGHAVGATVGFDLAHAAGNIPMELHDWNVDFAAWCTYKYLNSGPGGVAGCYVHERHVNNQRLPKFLGWWGTNKETRFQMETVFDAIPTAESWQVSNAPVLAMATLHASLDVIDSAGGIAAMRAKSERQIAYLDFLLAHVIGDRIESITPRAMHERGCQFALRVTDRTHDGKTVHAGLEAAGVACDWRYPDVIRVAPVPLYNSFGDIFRFVEILDGLLA